jgi:hypothetical protein
LRTKRGYRSQSIRSLLEPHADPVPEAINVAERIEAQDRDDAAVRRAHALDTFHGGGLSRAVGTDQAKIFVFSDDSKRNPVDGTAEQ